MILKPPKGAMLNRGHPLARGLVYCGLFNEGGGNIVNDLSGNGNKGSLIADTHFVSGKFGPCLSFDGTEDSVSLKKSILLSYHIPRTISIWFSATALGGVLLGGVSPQYYPYIDATRVYIRSGGAVSILHEGITLNQWHNLIITGPGSNIGPLLYIDGKLIGQFSVDAQPNITHIGAFSIGTSSFNGLIDNVQIYNRALTATEVLSLYRDPFQMFWVDL